MSPISIELCFTFYIHFTYCVKKGHKYVFYMCIYVQAADE